MTATDNCEELLSHVRVSPSRESVLKALQNIVSEIECISISVQDCHGRYGLCKGTGTGTWNYIHLDITPSKERETPFELFRDAILCLARRNKP